MSHSGQMFESQDVTGWTAGQLAEWVAANPGWAGATLMSCNLGPDEGSIVELERPKR